MLIDINTYIGHWPFRQLRDNTAQGLLKQMDKNGIDLAITASIHGIFYKNLLPANEEVAAQAKRYRDRIVPFAVINPLDADWEEDLRRSAEEMELKGLRLFPQYHGYSLTDTAGLELIDAAYELNWPIQVPMRVVDRRQRHPMDWASDLAASDFEDALAARPLVKWMILDALGLDGTKMPPNASYVVEISRMTAVLQRNIQGFIETAGHVHLSFGTGMPFKMPGPALLKLDVLDVPKTVREAIAWKNAKKVLLD
ncbi:MAG: amidohydrolase family protein [Candidatus Latescibacteria bacterium]|nr:amidohydrolase family protein [Candidatus Latescibacterota bacterium]